MNVLGEGQAVTIPVEIASYVTSEPRGFSVDVDLTDATLSWEIPADISGGAVDHYRIESHTAECDEPLDVTTTDDFLELEDLVEGCNYFVSVSAVNAGGTSLKSYVDFFAYGLPSAPTDPEVRLSDDGKLDVFWTDAYDNGSPVTSYKITVDPGSEVITVPAYLTAQPRHGTQVGDLTNGVPYTFTIQAVNAAGMGPAIESDELAPSDGALDADDDGLVDAAEERAGTDPMLDDTDGDGITDFDEVMTLSGITDPLLADSDDDSVPDDLEDADGDTITNAAEAAGGTSPASVDTDSDGLNDDAEGVVGTSALLSDSDADSLTDSYEVQSGSDPLDADSDSDSVADSTETIAVTIESDAQAVPDDAEAATAAIEGVAIDVQELVLEQAALADFPGAITTSARVSVRPSHEYLGALPPAISTLAFSYPDYITSAELASLAPVRWNDSLGTWEFVNNDVTVSTATRTISIVSPDLGLRYAVVDLGAWRANANQCLAAEGGHPALDVEIILDVTASVGMADSTGERYDAIRTVLNSLRPGDRVTIRIFGFIFVISSGPGG